MALSIRRLLYCFFLFSIFTLQVNAEGLSSLDREVLNAAEADANAIDSPDPYIPSLDGEAAGLVAVSAIEHYDATWLLAKNGEGNQVWLRFDPELGWQTKSSPHVEIQGTLVPGGQSHILTIGSPQDGTVSIHTYNGVTNTWSIVGQADLTGTVTALRATKGGYILTVAEPSGITEFVQLTVASNKRLLTWIDWVIIAVYLLFTAGIGFYHYLKDKKEKKSGNENFFLGGRSIPWWAAGISLYATGTSAISFIAIPAKSFATNWLYLAANVIGVIGTVFVAIWIVPLIRRLNLMSVYHYLEMRFHPIVRVVGSAIAIVLQLGGRMSIVLFLPSLAMSTVTGLNVTFSILIMGGVTIVYTVMGGMKAVIWTDVIQVFVMLGGAFIAVGYMITHLDNGVVDFYQTAMADQKFETFDWSFDLTKATVWGFLLVGMIGVLTYPQDQVMMQRVLSTKSDKEAGWSVWTLAVIVVPGNLTFFGIGTALYVFYKQFPTHLNPMLDVDSTFPQFIAAELPVGITGLIIAGIFAASMSTLSSCMNSVATLVSVDFYERYGKKVTPQKSVRLAEVITVVAGLIGIGTALLLASADIKSALDTSFQLAGLLGGGFAGCYALGLFTKRSNWQGALLGVISSLVLTSFAWTVNLVHPYFYLPVAVITCIVVGYSTSYLFPAPKQSLAGLTVYTPGKTPIVGE